MATIVHKYGGTSVADVDRIRRVAARVASARQEGYRVVVVVSAMAGRTDELLRLARDVDPSPPRRELDMLLSTGERVTMALLSMAVQRLGQDAISFTGSQSGILTTDRHFDARIIEVRPHRIEDELARGKVVIVAGYQGMSYRREITTLGRGGSDATAVALATSLEAERAEIYSDVDGVYTADPRLVPDARRHDRLGYDEMEALARAGAKVVHPDAVVWARRGDIPIHARSTFGSPSETVIGPTGSPETVAGVVGRKGLTEVVTQPADEAASRRLGTALEDAGVEVPIEIPGGPLPRRRFCASTAAPSWPEVGPALARDHGATLRPALGAVLAVGGDRAEVAAAFDDLGVHPVAEGTVGIQRFVVVPEEAVDDTVRRVHGRLVG